MNSIKFHVSSALSLYFSITNNTWEHAMVPTSTKIAQQALIYYLSFWHQYINRNKHECKLDNIFECIRENGSAVARNGRERARWTWGGGHPDSSHTETRELHHGFFYTLCFFVSLFEAHHLIWATLVRRVPHTLTHSVQGHNVGCYWEDGSDGCTWTGHTNGLPLVI